MGSLRSRKLKVLPFQFAGHMQFMGEAFEIEDCIGKDAVRIPAVVGRPGYYYDRQAKLAWHEFPDGSAWLARANQFLYEIHAIDRDQHPLTEEERAAIRTLLVRRVTGCEPQLQDRLWDDDQRLHIRDIRRQAWQARIEMLKGD